MPDFVNLLLQAKSWGVAPWDLVCPASRGHPCWQIWMEWTGELMHLRTQMVAAAHDRKAALDRIHQTNARRR